MAAPVTHYVKSDDVHIAYQVIGDGPLDLLFVPGFVSHIEATWQSPVRSSFFHRLPSFSRLILFDKRGTGMSDRGSQIFTLEQRMHDVRAILDEVGSERAALFGVSEGAVSRSAPFLQRSWTFATPVDRVLWAWRRRDGGWRALRHHF